MQASVKIAGGGAAAPLPASKLRPLPLSAAKPSNAVEQEVQPRNVFGVQAQPPSKHPQQQQQQQKQQEQGHTSHLYSQGSQQMGPSGKENAQPRNAAMMGLRDKMVEQIAAFQRRGRSKSPPVLANHQQQQQQQQPQKQLEQEQRQGHPAMQSSSSGIFEHRPLPEVPREDEISLLRRERDSKAAEVDALSSALRAYKEERARLVFDLDASHARAEQLKREKEATLEALRNRTRQAEEIADALEHCRGERDAAQRAATAALQSEEIAAMLEECRREVGGARRREAEALAHAEVARCERDDALRRVEALLGERDSLAHAISSSKSSMIPPASPSAEANDGNCSVGSPCPSSSEGGGAAAASPRLAWSLSPASSRGGSESPSPSMFASGDEEEHQHASMQQSMQQHRDQPTSLGVTIHGAPPGGGGRSSRHQYAQIAMVLSPVPEERMRAGTTDSDASSSSSRACGTSATPARRAIAFVSRLASAFSTRRIPSRSAVLSAWHTQAHSSSKGRRQAEVMSQRSRMMAVRVGWGAWCCHTSVMTAARREVESAQDKLQGADARVEIYKVAIISAATRRERDAIRRRVMQVMSANARWKGTSREAGRQLCAIASRLSSLAAMLAWRRIASERRISLRRVARTWSAWRVQTSASAMRQSLEAALCRATLTAWRGRASSCLAIASFYEIAKGRSGRRAKAAAMRAWRVEVEVVSLRISSCLRRSIAMWGSAVCVRDCLSGGEDAMRLVSLWRRAARRNVICCAFGRWRLEAGRGRGGRREREWEEREQEREELELKLKSAEGALILLLDSGLVIGPAQQQRHLHPQPSRAIM